MSHEAFLVVILGPTAVGKTEIAIQAAERMDGEIISADSRLLYRGMDIGTAKPTREEQDRVPHHLIDIADPDEEWSLTKFSAEATQAIDEVHRRGRIPFLVGGTGQYIRAIVEGWQPPPRGADNSFRMEMEAFAEAQGENALHSRLSAIDPESAARIHPSNVRRVIRALEIHHVTGVPASHQRDRVSPPYQILQIGLSLPREILYQRIDERIDAMLEEGLVEEVRTLISDGHSLDSPSMTAIGYKQIGKAIEEKTTLEDAVQEMRKLTRQFVRRQANWFKRDDPNIVWFEVDADVVDVVCKAVENFLEGNLSPIR